MFFKIIKTYDIDDKIKLEYIKQIGKGLSK